MNKTLKNVALAGLVAIGAMGAAPAAHADNLYFQFGLTDGNVYYKTHNAYRHRSCTPARALDKAERLGFRRVQLEDVKRNRIIVSGRKRGERHDIVFARDARSCPVIRIR